MFKRFFTIIALTVALAGPGALAAEEGATHTGATAEHAGAEHAGGEHAQRPLLDLRFSEAVWVVIIFSVMMIILYRTAWKNVLTGLKAREERIRNDLASADTARAQAEKAQKEYVVQLAAAESKVRDIIGSASADAERIAAQIRARGEQEAQEAKERAMREIEVARKQALSEIYDQAANLSTSIAEKILRRNLNADDQRDLVASSLEQLQGISKN